MLPSSRECLCSCVGVMLSLTSWLAATAMCEAQEQDQPRGQRPRRENYTQSPSQQSPLDRLRNRSAEERWQRQRDNQHWSPSDPFQRDWSVEDASQNAVPTTPSTAQAAPTASPSANVPVPPPAPFPWAATAEPEASATGTPATTNPFTPLDSELWQPTVTAPVDIEPTPAVRSTSDIPPVPPIVAEADVLLPTPAVRSTLDPFADSRWVELGDGPDHGNGPALVPMPASAPTIAPMSRPDSEPVFGIAPLPETQFSPSVAEVSEDDASGSTDGLIAPGGIAALAVVDDGSEPAPSPLPDARETRSSEFLARIKPIRDIVPYFQPEPMPVTHELPPSPTERGFVPAEFTWAASNVYHNPLYFEDFALERYGHSHHPVVQPFVSVGKFTGQFIGLPYKMAIDPVWDEEYVLGWYRPGELAPYLFYQVPWNWRAATTAAGTYTGLIFLFP